MKRGYFFLLLMFALNVCSSDDLEVGRRRKRKTVDQSVFVLAGQVISSSNGSGGESSQQIPGVLPSQDDSNGGDDGDVLDELVDDVGQLSKSFKE